MSAGLDLYSGQLDGFPQQDVELALTLAAYAAVALTNAQLHASQQHVAEHLELALLTRGVVDRAKGVLMAQRHCSAEDAFALLVGQTRTGDRELRDVAQEVVDGTSGSAAG